MSTVNPRFGRTLTVKCPPMNGQAKSEKSMKTTLIVIAAIFGVLLSILVTIKIADYINHRNDSKIKHNSMCVG